MAGINDINPVIMNSQVPLIPDLAWDAKATDYGSVTTPLGLVKNNFMWIQAFFNSGSLSAPADIVVTSGKKFETGPYTGQQVCSLITFAYSGERQLFRGTGIVTSGRDRNGDLITSTPLDPEAPTTSFSRIKFLGGMGNSQP